MQTAQTTAAAQQPTPATPAALATLALIVAGDLLLFNHEPGVNLFVFVLATVMAILLGQWPPAPGGRIAAAALMAALTALPLLEAPSLGGVAVAGLGLAGLALTAGGQLPRRFSALPSALCRFALASPMALLTDALRAAAAAPVGARGRWRTLLGWVVPGVFAVVFATLFAAANPLLEQALAVFDVLDLLGPIGPGRVIFWVVVAAAAWPLLRPRLLRARRGPVAAAVQLDGALFGHAAILRSLVIFNALFAVQTGLDLTFLWAGVALPGGMSHAEYAHRGAYPLIATALLAAAFVLAAMRPGGPGVSSPGIRALVYAWIGQNVLLCLSAALRLGLYVEVYGLTEMRLAAGAWMGLVAVGLMLILVRIRLHRSNAWLVASSLASLVVVLYGHALIDTAAVVAGYNVSHSRELGGRGQPLDVDYLLALGPSTIPAIDTYLRAAGPVAAPTAAVLRARRQLADRFARRPKDWRSWTLRDARLATYLGAQAAIASPPQAAAR